MSVKPSIWMAKHKSDGYFVAVFISPTGDENLAMEKAIEVFKGPDNRPKTEDDPEGWEEYDLNEIFVFELGDGYVGSDGEGNLEVDFDV